MSKRVNFEMFNHCLQILSETNYSLLHIHQQLPVIFTTCDETDLLNLVIYPVHYVQELSDV